MTDPKRDDPLDFDVTGVWRLFTDVQRLGFETAAAVARRFGTLIEEDLGPRWGVSRDKAADSQETGRQAPEDRLGKTVESAMNAYADLMQASWDAFNAVMDLSLDIARPWIRGMARDQVKLEGTANKGAATGSFYLHNTASKATGEIRVSSHGLIGPAGKTIDAASIGFEPAEVDSIPPGGHQEVKIEVALAKDITPGRYVGQIEATTDPATQLDLAVVVTDEAK